MRASNDFLIALMNKLTEIMENTTDPNTENELLEFINVIAESIQ